MLTVILLAVGLPMLWCFGTGYTAKLLDKETKWYDDTIWPASVFIWPILLLGIWGIEFQAWVSKRLDDRKTKKSLPPPPSIQIKAGAKITDWDQYSELMGLCTEFEARNGIDDKRLLEK